jgi:hypothetical protein
VGSLVRAGYLGELPQLALELPRVARLGVEGLLEVLQPQQEAQDAPVDGG